MSARLKNIFEERGDAGGTWGGSHIVCGPHGERLRPVSKSTRVNDAHAVFRPASVIVIDATYRHKDRQSMTISAVAADGTVTPTHTWSPDAGWDTEPPAHLSEAITAAERKATCYHCRECHYAA